MSLSYEIRESASSVAKKYDHSESTKLHILYGIRRKFPKQLNELGVEEIEKRISALPKKAIHYLLFAKLHLYSSKNFLTSQNNFWVRFMNSHQFGGNARATQGQKGEILPPLDPG